MLAGESRVPGQPRLFSKSLSQNNSNKKSTGKVFLKLLLASECIFKYILKYTENQLSSSKVK
jgi:hypothetical protein